MKQWKNESLSQNFYQTIQTEARIFRKAWKLQPPWMWVVKMPGASAFTEISTLWSNSEAFSASVRHALLAKANERSKERRIVPEMMLWLKKSDNRSSGNSPPERRYAWMHLGNVETSQSDFGTIMWNFRAKCLIVGEGQISRTDQYSHITNR